MAMRRMAMRRMVSATDGMSKTMVGAPVVSEGANVDFKSSDVALRGNHVKKPVCK